MSKFQDHLEQRQFSLDQMKETFLTKEVTDRAKTDMFKSACYMRHLTGTAGTAQRQKLIWKPDKLSFPKKSVKIYI